MLKIFVCSARVKSVNPALGLVGSDGCQFLQKEYRAVHSRAAKEGFIQYLHDNKNFTFFKNVIVK